MTQQLAINTKHWKIKTASGFVSFAGVAQMGVKQLYKVTFDDDSTISASASHVLFTSDGRDILVGELTPGIVLLGVKNRTVVTIQEAGIAMTYDVIDTSTHTYYANGILSHNCRFLSNDLSLIDQVALENLNGMVEGVRPFGVMGDIVFYKEPVPNSIYLVGMDPSAGSGNDYCAIVAYEFPSLEQVAEFRSNTTSSVVSYHMLKKLLKIFERAKSTVYFSVENNGVGEAVMALLEADESPPETAEFISETGQKRRGMTTSGKSKIKACLAMKEMIERNSLLVRSKVLVAELKHFVRSKGSYAAKRGSTDDLVMATLIAVRLLEEIAMFDQNAYDKMYSHAYIREDLPTDYDQNGDGGVDGMVLG